MSDATAIKSLASLNCLTERKTQIKTFSIVENWNATENENLKNRKERQNNSKVLYKLVSAHDPNKISGELWAKQLLLFLNELIVFV